MSQPATAKALVGVSACLLGEEVRYDGAHKLDAFVSGKLARLVELRPVCPEVDIGLGIPREPIRLETSGNGTRLVATESGKDLTAAMEDYASTKVRELHAEAICGYVLKSRSPSCGLGSAPIAGAENGDGLFAAALRRLCDQLPIAEETGLGEPGDRELFLARVLAYRRLRDVFDGDWSISELVEHHTRQKLLLMAYSPELYSRLGRLVAEAANDDPAEVEDSYRRMTMEAFSRQADPGRHSNALDHMRGYFRNKASVEEYEELGDRIEEYRGGERSLGEVLDHFRRLVKQHSVDYLALQVYLAPQPAELLVPADQ
jgi:uncharacterized protein YbbK (DUF523 family)/uncharacterized protein YbgA (DUF1722 family)